MRIWDCGPNLFCDLRTFNFRKSANAYFFSLQKFGIYRTVRKCSHSKYKIKFVLKRELLGLFCERVVQYFVEICGFAICGLNHENLRICRLAHRRNLRICDSGMSPKICRFVIRGLLEKGLLGHLCFNN
jgi:hypothetical protein